MDNIYLPEKVKITKIEKHSSDVKLFRLQKTKGKFPKNDKGLFFTPGQFVLAGIWGYGEAPFGPSSSPEENSYIEILVRNTGGNVTSALHQSKENDEITLRGPYGNGFPLDFFENKDIVMVTGGCGIPPIASLIEYIIRRREKFGEINLVYGAKTPADLLMKEQMNRWQKYIKIILSVDQPAQEWRGCVGLAPEFIKEAKFDAAKTAIAMCGPGPMMTAVGKIVNPLGITNKMIFANTERKMQCGIGKCQHCATGEKYACLNGPVFRLDEINENWD